MVGLPVSPPHSAASAVRSHTRVADQIRFTLYEVHPSTPERREAPTIFLQSYMRSERFYMTKLLQSAPRPEHRRAYGVRRGFDGAGRSIASSRYGCISVQPYQISPCRARPQA